jgi:ribosomal protein S6--L-glutamate ligase
MKIAILSYRPLYRQAAVEEFRLKHASIALGHTARILRAAKCQLLLDRNGSCLLYDGRKLPTYDLVIPRMSVLKDVPLEASLIEQFQVMGIPVVNRCHPVILAKNKLGALQRLNTLGIPITKTMVIRRIEHLDDAIRYVGGTPVVIKSPYGSYGYGVVICETKRSARCAVEMLLGEEGRRQIVLVQEYIKESKGRDIRAFVVGRKVVASMERQAGRGEFRANVELGAASRSVVLDPTMTRLSLRATEALDLQIAGVDIIVTHSGPAVMEVNANPGFKGLEDVTGVDVASEIIKYGVDWVSHCTSMT